MTLKIVFTDKKNNMQKNELTKTEKRVSRMEKKAELKIKLLVSVAAVSNFAGLNTDAHNLELIAEYLAEYYQNIEPPELLVAYKMTISGRLDGYFPQQNGQPQKEHYGNFSAAWISKMLNAYKQHKRDHTKTPVFKELPPSREQLIATRKTYIEYLVKLYEDHIAGKKINILLPLHVCDVLHKVNLLDEKPSGEENIQGAIMEIIKSNTVNHYARKQAIHDPENSDIVKAASRRQSAKKLILKTFDELKANEIKFKEYLEKNYGKYGN